MSKGLPGWGMKDSFYLGSFYASEGDAVMICLHQVWTLEVAYWFPRVVAFGVALPLDEVLQRFLPPLTSVAANVLDLVLFFVIHEVWGWSRIIGPVFHCLDEWS